MFLSVIVPLYKEKEEGSRFCLDSLINQTFDDMEIIIVDDKADENNLKLIEEYKGKCDKIKVINNEAHLGPGSSWNRALFKVMGEYVAFINPKDYLDTKYYELMANVVKTTKSDVAGSDNILVYEYGSKKGEEEKLHYNDQSGELDDEKKADLIIKPGYLGCKIIKKSLLDENGLWAPDFISSPDVCLNPLVLMCARSFAYVPEAKAYTYKESGESPEEVYTKCDDRMTAMTYFIEECVKREFFGDFLDEIEYRYTEDMFIKNLFTYMSKVPEKMRKPEFSEDLHDGITYTFPEFMDNPYYEIYDDESIRELAGIFIESPKKFNKVFSKILQGQQ